jgi:hypothetical protein
MGAHCALVFRVEGNSEVHRSSMNAEVFHFHQLAVHWEGYFC